MNTLYEKNNFTIYTEKSEKVQRYGIRLLKQVPVCGIIFSNKKTYRKMEYELSFSFSYNSLVFYWVK
jgi:hypothetical protein